MLCRLFGHRRSKRKRTLEEGGWRSACRWCGNPMRRWGHHDWRVDSRPDHGEAGREAGATRGD